MVSQTVITDLGLIIKLPSGHPYAIEMPCGDFERMSEEQFEGKTSIAHFQSCRAKPPCTYHETHNFAAAVRAAGGFQFKERG